MKKIMSVSVIGLGYIGLPTALLMAEQGIHVFGYDTNPAKKKSLDSGQLPFDENGLLALFTRVRAMDTFQVTKQLHSSQYYLVSVPTPQENGKADLSYVRSALESIKLVFQPNQTIIIESTIGPRDCIDELIPFVSEWGKPFHFAHCPERAIPGNTLHEMVFNDRIIGGDTSQSAKEVARLYSTFVRGPIHQTNTIVAASCKVMENTYRAVNIALANEFAQLAQTLDFDVWEAIALANKHPRVHIHQPGPGVGGHCIPIDPWFFVGSGEAAPLIETALKKNEDMAAQIAAEIEVWIQQHLTETPTIAILGYAYKKNVDDFRETPAEPLRSLLSKKYTVLVTDPHVHTPLITPQKKALAESVIWIVVTDHDLYTKIDVAKYPQVKYIYDCRNCIQPKQLTDFHGTYRVLGRGRV